MRRIAIVGAGGIGAQHAEALMALPGAWRISHICDSQAALAERLAARTGAQVIALEDLLAHPDIDVIDICLPPALHVDVTLRALAAGKDVICEKPIAGSLADVDRLKAAEAETGRRVFPVFQYRYGPAIRHLLAVMEAGHLGQPRVATLETHWSRDSSYYATAWRGTWAHEMGGACLSHAIHIHDLVGLICGQIKSVSAFVDTLINSIETEDCAAICMCTNCGCLVTSSITLGAAVDETRLRIVFQHGTVDSGRSPYTPGEARWQIRARDPARQPLLDSVGVPEGANGFTGYFADIAAALDARPNRAVTLADGAASIALVTAIYHAARRGETVTLPLGPEMPLYHGWGPHP